MGEKWQKCTGALEILWTVGGRLRAVYNGSKSEEERRKDRRSTYIRLAAFAVASVVFTIIDAYGDPVKAVGDVSQHVGQLLRRGKRAAA